MTMESKYYKRRTAASIVSLVLFLIFAAVDIGMIIKWHPYGEFTFKDAIGIFIMAMIFHGLFLLLSFIWYLRRRIDKPLNGAVLGLVILVLASAMAVMMADNMVDYVYKSRTCYYSSEEEFFYRDASMTVTSEDLVNGRWSDAITDTDEGSNLSPQLSFDEVPGASCYVIYMVDESANYWVHWYAEVPSAASLETGDNPGLYKGPYPPAGSGEHTYAVYVFALEGEVDLSGREFTYPQFDEPWFSADVLYNILTVRDSSMDPDLYGNVLAFGYITGTYSR